MAKTNETPKTDVPPSKVDVSAAFNVPAKKVKATVTVQGTHVKPITVEFDPPKPIGEATEPTIAQLNQAAVNAAKLRMGIVAFGGPTTVEFLEG